MATSVSEKKRFASARWILAALVALLLGAILVFRPNSEPLPPLTLHSVPYAVQPGTLPLPDRWLLHTPQWRWLWIVRSRIWPKNPSVSVGYSVWAVNDTEPLSRLAAIESKTNEGWKAVVLAPAEAAKAMAILNEEKGTSGLLGMNLSTGEGSLSTLNFGSCRIDAAVAIRGAVTGLTTSVQVRDASIAGMAPCEVAFQAAVPNGGAVLLTSVGDGPRQVWLANSRNNP